MQADIIIRVISPGPTSVTFAPSGVSLVAPVAAGAVLGQIVILPAAWSGPIVVSGADASSFNVDASRNLVAAVALTQVKNYAVTVTVAP